jgi:hypothetical protein
MLCADINAAMGTGEVCEETDEGARFVTHCLYPSFTPVAVHIVKLGDGYRVTDGGGALNNAWAHGREIALAKRMVYREAERYHLKVSPEGALVADALTIEWLRAAILTVANASAGAANATLGKLVAAAESALKDEIKDKLTGIVPPESIRTDVEVIGKSGDTRHFDYGIRAESESDIVISAVTSHRNSVASKFLAFSDTIGVPGLVRYGAYDKAPDRGDLSMLLQVVEVLPMHAFEPRIRAAIAS